MPTRIRARTAIFKTASTATFYLNPNEPGVSRRYAAGPIAAATTIPAIFPGSGQVGPGAGVETHSPLAAPSGSTGRITRT